MTTDRRDEGAPLTSWEAKSTVEQRQAERRCFAVPELRLRGGLTAATGDSGAFSAYAGGS